MLLIRPCPKDKELLPQYLVRLSVANGYHNTHAMMKVIGESLANTRIPGKRLYFGNFDIKRLATAVNLTPERINECKLKRISVTRYLYNGQQFSLKTTSFNYLRVCPLCYAETPELNLLNSINAKTACAKHRCALLDIHPETGKKLNWGTQYLGQKIATWADNIPLREPFQAELVLNECIEALWSSTDCLPYAITDSISLAEFLDLISFFAHFHQRAFGKDVISTQQSYLAPAHWYLSEWPQPYNELLEYFQNNPMASNRLNGLRKCYRDLYDNLYSPQNACSRGYKLLREQFENYIVKGFSDGPLLSSVKWIQQLKLESFSFLNEIQTCKYLSIPNTKLKILVREGILPPFKQLENGTLLFSRLSLLPFKNKLSSCLSLTHAAKLLEISDYHMRALLKARLIKTLLQPSAKNRDWLIEKAELVLFVSKLKSRSIKGLQTTDHAVKRHTFAGENLVSLLKKMLSDAVKYTYIHQPSSPLSLGQFYPEFKTNEAEHLGLLTPKEVCLVLGINKNVIYDLITKGLIDSTRQSVKRTPRPVLFIPRSSVDTFKSKYLLKHQIENLHLNQLTIISGPKIDGGLINIYQR
ncbi:TniQ family protein [Shewanella vesiculosa]|uniref:TniQ family protein n=1 Tax=Shewanella vesiculosa TaxID=518738 RepID=UPI00384D71F9